MSIAKKIAKRILPPPALDMIRNVRRVLTESQTDSKPYQETQLHGDDRPRVPMKSCSICGSEEQILLFTKVTTNGPLSTILCGHCGTMRLDQRVEDAWLEDSGKHGGIIGLDEEMTIETMEKSYVDDRKRFGKLTFDYLSQHIASFEGKRVIEVSSGTGGIVSLFKDAGAAAFGLEASEVQANYATDVKGIKTFATHIRDHNPDEGYDLLLGVRLINHFANPLDIMHKIHSLLNDGGYLFLTTKDTPHEIKRKGMWRLMAPDHPYMFSLPSLKLLFANSGFELVDYVHDEFGGHDFGTRNHIHTLCRKVNHPLEVNIPENAAQIAYIQYLTSMHQHKDYMYAGANPLNYYSGFMKTTEHSDVLERE